MCEIKSNFLLVCNTYGSVAQPTMEFLFPTKAFWSWLLLSTFLLLFRYLELWSDRLSISAYSIEGFLSQHFQRFPKFFPQTSFKSLWITWFGIVTAMTLLLWYQYLPSSFFHYWYKNPYIWDVKGERFIWFTVSSTFSLKWADYKAEKHGRRTWHMKAAHPMVAGKQRKSERGRIGMRMHSSKSHLSVTLTRYVLQIREF